eukprot:10586087-Alexandrium_andersonii.AAC.1
MSAPCGGPFRPWARLRLQPHPVGRWLARLSLCQGAAVGVAIARATPQRATKGEQPRVNRASRAL